MSKAGTPEPVDLIESPANRELVFPEPRVVKLRRGDEFPQNQLEIFEPGELEPIIEYTEDPN